MKAIWSIFLKKTDFTCSRGPWESHLTGQHRLEALHQFFYTCPRFLLIVWIVWVNLVVKTHETHETVKLWEFSASRRFNNRESCIFHSLIRTSRLFFVCSSFFQFVAQTAELTMTGSTGSKPSTMSGSAI